MKLNLQFKIISIVFFSASLIFGVLFYDNFKNYEKGLTESFLIRARATVQSLETSIEKREDINNKEKLLSSIQKQIWLDPDIVGISFDIFDEDNESLRVHISNDPGKINRAVLDINIESYEQNRVVSQIRRIRGKRVLSIVSPVHVSGKILGTYQMEMTLEGMDSRIGEERISALRTLGVMLFLFILILFFLLRMIIIKPIRLINKGLEGVTKNDLSLRVKVGSRDELGQLASSFNHMMEMLEKTRKELKGHSKNLEKKVKERTGELESKNKALEKFNKSAIGRETKMISLKRKIAELEKELKEK